MGTWPSRSWVRTASLQNTRRALPRGSVGSQGRLNTEHTVRDAAIVPAQPAGRKEGTELAVKPSRDRWFGRIANLLRSSRLDDSVWEEIEEILISSDVGVETSLRMIERLRQQVRQERLDTPEAVTEALKQALVEDLDTANETTPSSGAEDGIDSTERPYVILMVGVNGVGKTTSIGKLAHHFTGSGRKVVLGAGDTFRAAAAEQLEILGQRVGVDVIRHAAGADPGAVAFDAYQASKSRGATCSSSTLPGACTPSPT